jgi:hypothetical protein
LKKNNEPSTNVVPAADHFNAQACATVAKLHAFSVAAVVYLGLIDA